MKFRSFVKSLLLIPVVAIGNASLPQSQSSNIGSTITADFIQRVHYGDLLDVNVVGNLEYDWRGGVTPEGFLDGFDRIPNQIYVLCRTEQEIANEIASELSKILRNPKVEVRIVDKSKRAAAIIDGAVKTPQRLQIKRTVRLNEIVILSGGFTDRTSGEILISRPKGLSCVDAAAGASSSTDKTGVPHRFDIKISDMLSGSPEANPLIVSGDLIIVLEAQPVYLIGAIGSPGRIDFRPQLTLARAIDSAGGLAKDAVEEKVNVFRREGRSSAMITADLRSIRANATPDLTLKPFDIIDVPFKGRPPRRLPPVIENDIGRSDRTSKLPMRIIE